MNRRSFLASVPALSLIPGAVISPGNEMSRAHTSSGPSASSPLTRESYWVLAYQKPDRNHDIHVHKLRLEGTDLPLGEVAFLIGRGGVEITAGPYKWTAALGRVEICAVRVDGSVGPVIVFWADHASTAFFRPA